MYCTTILCAQFMSCDIDSGCILIFMILYTFSNLLSISGMYKTDLIATPFLCNHINKTHKSAFSKSKA